MLRSGPFERQSLFRGEIAAMTEVKLGRKIQCSECETRFYDLGKSQAACPKCGKIYVEPGEKPVKPPVASSRSRLQRVEKDRGGGDDESDEVLAPDDDVDDVDDDDDDDVDVALVIGEDDDDDIEDDDEDDEDD
jgi:hypothetical protein